MGVKQTVLPDSQPLTVVFTVVAQLYGPKANETETGAPPFNQTWRGKKLSLDINL